jgi:hypothetical protein
MPDFGNSSSLENSVGRYNQGASGAAARKIKNINIQPGKKLS